MKRAPLRLAAGRLIPRVRREARHYGRFYGLTENSSAPEIPASGLKRFVAYAQIAGPIIALGGIALAGWGYWTTVLPVLQYQQLKEQSVSLEIKNKALSQEFIRLTEENAQAARTLDAARQRLAEEERRAKSLQDTLIRAEAARSRSLKMTAEARLREAQANALAARSEADLRTRQAALEKATWAVLFDALDESLLGRSLSDASKRISATDSPGQFILDHSSGTNPYSILRDLVDGLPRSRYASALVPLDYYSHLASMIDDRRVELHCDAPSVAERHAAFLEEYESARHAASTEADAYVAKEVQKIEAQGKQAAGIDEAKSEVFKRNLSNEAYKLTSKYLRLVYEDDRKCYVIQKAVLNRIRASKGLGPRP